MHKLKYILFSFILLTLLPLSVKADCQSDFKAIEKEFKVTYEYNKDTDDFTITIVNPNYEKYEYGFKPDHLSKYKYSGYRTNTTITQKLTGYKEDTYYYLIVGVNSNCKGTVYKIEDKKLYKYNPYSESELCKGNEDFALCQREYDKEIDEETFKSRLETYKETKKEQKEENGNRQNEETQKEKNNWFKRMVEKIKNYINDNLIEVIAILVFAIALIVTIILGIKSSVKSRRLE